MQPVHFVWLGPAPNPIGKAIDTCNAVANKCKSREIRFWCLPAHANAFQPHLNQYVTVKTLDRIRQKDLALGGNWKARALEVFEILQKKRAFVACKDLLNLLLLHTYGGYTLDTTAFVAAPGVLTTQANLLNVRSCAVDKAFAKKHTYPHFPVVADFNPNGLGTNIYHQPDLINVSSVTEGEDFKDNTGLALPQIDVWAMYSPKGHALIARAIQSYVKRAEYLGMTHAHTPLNDEGVSGYMILKRGRAAGASDDEKDARNKLIGNLMVRSVYDGLIATHGRDAATIMKHSFKARRYRAPGSADDDKPTDVCPELGIIKEYNGTWRM